MQLRALGREGPEISVVGWGGWQAGERNWGAVQPTQNAIDAIHAGLDAGMTWVDTAEVYGNGTSERTVGRAIASIRDRVSVFTKVAPDEGSGIRPEQIAGAMDASLLRLGIDHVDLYQVHWPDDDVPVEETWGAMAELVLTGKARYIGVSNFDRALVERILPIHPVASVQNELSLVARDDTADLLPWLAEQGIGYLAYSPLGSGLLSGHLTADRQFGDDDWRSGRGRFASERTEGREWPFDPDPLARTVEAMTQVAALGETLGLSPAQVALRWVLEQHGVTAVIAGSLSAEHTVANAAAGDTLLDAGTVAALDAIFAQPVA
jgi:aryl-alcohol dehydrogenase-like predicted oxidoreductase